MDPTAAFKLQNPTEEHHMLRQMVQNFAQDVVEPQADEHDRKGELNVDLLRQCGELGLHGITIPAEAGGSGMDLVASVMAATDSAENAPSISSNRPASGSTRSMDASESR